LYDFSQVPIPTDNVGAQQTAMPRPWHMGTIARFILFIGPISSIFDYTTYAMMWFVFKCNHLALGAPAGITIRFAGAMGADQTYAAALFHTGWFVESLATQTLVLFVIRTSGSPLASRPSRPLAITTLAIVAVGLLLPATPLAPLLGCVVPPVAFFAFLAAATAAYLCLVEIVKRRLVARNAAPPIHVP
ncbi:MAG TPA: cation transporting ATPase C-terminal domain-containing protein, partial [Vicinamibacterales bacterium]|nr:cation transporting ATPase C-terminal domain-containing protein [Vicinamibacterales bacterium]